MPIRHPPSVGTILRCDFSPGFQQPEMVKRRPVVVVSPRLPHRPGLCTVVPLSTSAPEHPQPFHLALTLATALPPPFTTRECWVKADMRATVAFHRLDMFRDGRAQDGTRNYITPKVTDAELRAIRICIAHALGMFALLSPQDGNT